MPASQVLSLVRGSAACRGSEPGIVARMSQSQRLVQARHAAGDFAFADAQVTRNALVGQVALNQPKQLELGAHKTAPQLTVCEAMHPGRPCHSIQCVILWLLLCVHLASNARATSPAVLTQPKK